MPIVSCPIAALVLAAGGGTRLGGGKLLLPWKGRPLIVHALAAVLQSGAADSVALVLGHGAEPVRAAILRAFPDHSGLTMVVNSDWRKGQGTSLRLGLRTLRERHPGARAALVALGDQPSVRAETLRLLAERHREAVAADPGHPATVPFYGGRRGNPVILSRTLFGAAEAVRGDKGARDILAALGDRVLGVAVEDSGVVRDIDTAEAYAELIGKVGS